STSTLCFKRDRTTSLSPCIAASESRASPAQRLAATHSPPIQALANMKSPSRNTSHPLNCDLPGAVAETGHIHAQLTHHGQHHVRHGRAIFHPPMELPLQLAVSMAG